MSRVNINKETLGETSIFLSRISIILILYLVFDSILPQSLHQIKLIICTLLFTTVISQTTMLQSLKRKIYKYAYELNEVKEIKLDQSRTDLLYSIFDLKSYLQNAYKWNNKRRILFKKMSPLQQQIASVTNYAKKLNMVDKYFEKNNKILSTIVSNSIEKYKIKDYELKIVEEQYKLNKKNNYFRVVESLCHYARDWPLKPCDEITPLINYIKKQADELNNEQTIAIVPGSGLGKVAHTLANDLNFSSVHAVEFSWLMVLMNEYLFMKENKGKQVEIYPYLHTYSNHLSTNDQIRSVEIQHDLEKPENLFIHTADFTKFDINEHLRANEKPKNAVIVTCFFLDTAENLVEYIQSIDRIAAQVEGTTKWINVGPLKYGTAAQIELSDEELKTLIKSLRWKVTDEVEPELLGYLTDRKGLWQGYYNVTKWTAVKP